METKGQISIVLRFHKQTTRPTQCEVSDCGMHGVLAQSEEIVVNFYVWAVFVPETGMRGVEQRKAGSIV
eukprot:2301793-Amphidinium_carterae.2